MLAILELSAIMIIGSRYTRSHERVYGNEEGIFLRRKGEWRLIPWRNVGPVSYPWYATNPVGRVYKFEIDRPEGGKELVYFRPAWAELAACERLRIQSAQAPRPAQ